MTRCIFVLISFCKMPSKMALKFLFVLHSLWNTSLITEKGFPWSSPWTSKILDLCWTFLKSRGKLHEHFSTACFYGRTSLTSFGRLWFVFEQSDFVWKWTSQLQLANPIGNKDKKRSLALAQWNNVKIQIEFRQRQQQSLTLWLIFIDMILTGIEKNCNLKQFIARESFKKVLPAVSKIHPRAFPVT